MNLVPTNCIPSPESPAKRMVTAGIDSTVLFSMLTSSKGSSSTGSSTSATGSSSTGSSTSATGSSTSATGSSTTG